MPSKYQHLLDVRGPVLQVCLASLRDMAQTLGTDPTSLRLQVFEEKCEARILATYERVDGAGTSLVRDYIEEVDGVVGTLLWYNLRRNTRGYGVFQRQQPPIIVQEKVAGLGKLPRLFPDSYPVSPHADFLMCVRYLKSRKVSSYDYASMRADFPFGGDVSFKNGKPDYSKMHIGGK